MSLRHADKRLVQAFFAWKAVLLVVAALSPGPGYDTSALIASNPSPLRQSEFRSWSTANRISLNLFRWDALYFVKSAQRGYIYEQEWAFSWVHSLLIKTLVRLVSSDGPDALQYYVWTGILISNMCHLVSVLVLFRLANVLLHRRNERLSFIASALHIVSPAGMFLSAPYAESLFSALNFTGMLLYARASIPERPGKKQTIREDVSILGASMLFILATWIRSNGLLSGLLFVFDVVSCLPPLFKMELSMADIRRLAVTCTSGALLGLGSMLPQYVAYQEYCIPVSGQSARPWCSKTIPSIYTWVQSNYWNVGFLRYWTLSNLPLFLIAGPMLWLLLYSGIEHLRYSTRRYLRPHETQPRGQNRDGKGSDTSFANLPQLALPQLVLAVTAATNFHVQVINRLSSGYPVWYLAVARRLVVQITVRKDGEESRVFYWLCRGLIMYALVQGALFANFLPPA